MVPPDFQRRINAASRLGSLEYEVHVAELRHRRYQLPSLITERRETRLPRTAIGHTEYVVLPPSPERVFSGLWRDRLGGWHRNDCRFRGGRGGGAWRSCWRGRRADAADLICGNAGSPAGNPFRTPALGFGGGHSENDQHAESENRPHGFLLLVGFRSNYKCKPPDAHPRPVGRSIHGPVGRGYVPTRVLSLRRTPFAPTTSP